MELRQKWEAERKREEEIRREARLEVAKQILGFRMVGQSPIGPLHQVGWNEAVEFIEKRLAALAAPKGPAGSQGPDTIAPVTPPSESTQTD